MSTPGYNRTLTIDSIRTRTAVNCSITYLVRGSSTGLENLGF